LSQSIGGLDSVEPGHRYIKYDHIRLAGGLGVQHLLTVSDCSHYGILVLQSPDYCVTHCGVILSH
jgi:hypothetical protein